MRPTFAIGLVVSWPRVTAAFLTGVVVLWLGSRVGGPVAAWAALTALLAASVVVTWRQVPVGDLLARNVAPVRWRSRGGDPAERTDEHALRWSGVAGAVRWEGDEVVAAVVLDGPSHALAVLDKRRVQTSATVSVALLAGLLRQFDVRLAGIDLHSVGARRALDGHHPHATTYSTRVGDYPAVGVRRSWCALRFDVRDNLSALLCRDSVAAMVVACAQRAAETLTAAGCPARVATVADLDRIDATLAGGWAADTSRVRWGGVSIPGAEVTSYWVSPHDISTETLDRVWAPDAERTATTLQLRPGPLGRTQVGALVRYSTAGPLHEPPITGLNPLSSRHEDAIRAGLATAATPALRVPHRDLGNEDEALRVPISSTGIIVGATSSGHPVLLNLTPARDGATARVTVAGELALLVQIALRSAAIGYRVLVVSERPAAWHTSIAAGLRVVTAEVPMGKLPDDGHGIMVIYDDEAAPLSASPHAAVVVHAVPRRGASLADVHIEQESSTSAAIRTAETQFRARIDLVAERNMVNPPAAARHAS